jgi:hypothetical protein
MSWIEPPTGRTGRSGRAGRAAQPGIELASPLGSLRRCPVCGFAELRFDEVAHPSTAGSASGLLELAECPRCEHRATRPLSSRVQPAAVAGLDGESAAAA